MNLPLPAIIQYKDLLAAWTRRTIRGRYQQSLLGWLWAIVQPVASVAIFSLIFTTFVPVDTGEIPYPVFSYIAMVPWTFFASSIQDMTISLTLNFGLVTKVYFPREVLPISAMLARLLDFGVASLVLALMMLFYRVEVNPELVLFLPLVLLAQAVLITGLGLITSAANVFYRDMQPLLILLLQVWFYASPIIYPVSLVPEQWRVFYYLNPMAGILEAYRSVLLYQQVPDHTFLIAAGEAMVVFVFGYWLFKRVEFQFADII
ncbi:MAG: ABC transporter permease [Anaerolineae bacterium]|nr:ABC transporter permease [Anaerolineae bacterium]